MEVENKKMRKKYFGLLILTIVLLLVILAYNAINSIKKHNERFSACFDLIDNYLNNLRETNEEINISERRTIRDNGDEIISKIINTHHFELDDENYILIEVKQYCLDDDVIVDIVDIDGAGNQKIIFDLCKILTVNRIEFKVIKENRIKLQTQPKN